MTFSSKTCTLLFASAILAAGCSNSGGSGAATAANLCQSQTEAQSTLENSATDHRDFIIKMKSGARALSDLSADLQQSADDGESTTVEAINENLHHIRLPNKSRAVDVVSKYIHSDDIEFIEPDYELHGVQEIVGEPEQTAQAITLSSKQWAHGVVDSQQAWAVTQGKNSVVVGVIDTGSDPTHPDLKNAMWKNPNEVVNGIDDDKNGYIDDIYGWDFVHNDNAPVADDTRAYHGTHVSGTIAGAQNATLGISGEAPNIKIMPLKYLDSSATGSTSNAIKAIDYAINKHVRILSNSWGSWGSSTALENAILRAQKAGILFVAAAGNGDSSGHGVNLDKTNFYPAGFSEPNIVSVAASNSYDQLAAWSNFGALRVDLAAPGVSIYSTRNKNQYAYLSGTSMATPLVSGVAALVLSVRPDFTYSLIKQALMNSVDKVAGMNGKVASGGRINAYKAVMWAKNYKGTVPSSSDAPSVDPAPTPVSGTAPVTGSCR